MSKTNENEVIINERPSKDDFIASNTKKTVGRPKKTENIINERPKNEKSKNSVGRPKKENSIVEKKAKQALAETLVQKRPVGRPKKEGTLLNERTISEKNKRPVGRPRKEDSNIYAYIGPISIANKDIMTLLSDVMKFNSNNNKVNLVLSKSLEI